MKRWQRWITFTILVLLALGPGPFWSPSKAKADSGFSQGWTAVPLPQQLLEAKAKFASLGLIAVALGLAMHSPSVPICLPLRSSCCPLGGGFTWTIPACKPTVDKTAIRLEAKGQKNAAQEFWPDPRAGTLRYGPKPSSQLDSEQFAFCCRELQQEPI